MKVAFFLDSADSGAFSASFGGAAWGLYENGVRHIDALFLHGDETEKFPPNTRFIKLPGKRVLKALGPLLSYLNKERPDFLITGPTYINLAVIPVFLISSWKIKSGKLIITHHHPLSLAHIRSKKNNKYFAKIAYQLASASYGVSPAVREEAIEYTGLNPQSVAVIPNIIIPETLDKDSTIHPWLSNAKNFVFVSVSRLAEEKNIPFLVECFACLRMKQEAKLIIAGTGPEKSTIAQTIRKFDLENDVSLVGFVDSAKGLMAHASAFVLTSNEEGFGQVITEAMSVGCPVICTDALGGGVSYVTSVGKYAKLIPRNNKTAFVDAMCEIMDPTENEKYSALGLERAKAFSAQKVGKELLLFLEEVRHGK